MMIKNMVQIHDEQRSIQMTLHRHYLSIHKKTAQTSTEITNNGSKNSKFLLSEKRQQQCQLFK